MEIAAGRGFVSTRVASSRLAAQRALLPWPQLSVFFTCAAVSFLPFLQPAGPGNVFEALFGGAPLGRRLSPTSRRLPPKQF